MQYNLQLTGSESNVDLWMLSRLSCAVKICDEGMAQYDFTAATTACYNLWLYDLCDVYLVSTLLLYKNLEYVLNFYCLSS